MSRKTGVIQDISYFVLYCVIGKCCLNQLTNLNFENTGETENGHNCLNEKVSFCELWLCRRPSFEQPAVCFCVWLGHSGRSSGCVSVPIVCCSAAQPPQPFIDTQLKPFSDLFFFVFSKSCQHTWICNWTEIKDLWSKSFYYFSNGPLNLIL